MDRWIEIIVSILSGVAVVIPLAWQLIKYVATATKEKSWPKMIELLMSLMADAEKRFDDGSSKKEWVIGQLQALAHTINFDIDWAVASDMIDKLCEMSKKINK